MAGKKATKATPKKAATPERGDASAALQRAGAARDPEARLAEAIAAWQSHPSPEVGAAVVRAAAIAGRGREAITGLDHAERQAAWLRIEKAGAPADVDRLLATLVETRCEHAIERMARLAKRPRDPRLVEQLVRYIEADPSQRQGETSPVPFTSQPNRPFWNALVRLVEERGDAAIAGRLRKVAARKTSTNFERWLAEKCRALATVLEARVAAPLAAAERAALATLDAALAREEASAKPLEETGDALYAAVWAAPDDDAPRLVLADFLSERGDPRGEFITLQLARAAGKLDKAGAKREKELLKRHKKLWVGPIGPLTQQHSWRFERGFLVTCTLEPNAELEATLGTHPAWSTIREYYFHDYAKRTAVPLAKLLAKHGAVLVSSQRFTRGLA